ncbi:MAG: flagellar protein FlaG [Burkholderiales bacterium]
MQPIASGNHLAPGSTGSDREFPRALDPVQPKAAKIQAAASAVVLPTPEQVAEAIATANEALQSISSSVEFSLDSSTGKTVIRIVDSGNQQVIRQVPSEEMLAIARAVDRLQGLLLRQRV